MIPDAVQATNLLSMFKRGFAGLCACLMLMATAYGQETQEPVLFKDWTVQCATKDAQKLCIMKQVLNLEDQKGPLLRIELSKNQSGGMSGLIIVPFGLDVTKGISLSIDGGARWNLPFRTCQTFGCVIPVSIASQMVEELKKSNSLNVYLYALDGVSNFELPVSLAGFTSAFDAL